MGNKGSAGPPVFGENFSATRPGPKVGKFGKDSAKRRSSVSGPKTDGVTICWWEGKANHNSCYPRGQRGWQVKVIRMQITTSRWNFSAGNVVPKIETKSSSMEFGSPNMFLYTINAQRRLNDYFSRI